MQAVLTASHKSIDAGAGAVSIAGELNAVQWRWALGLLQEREA